jgi:hypothetical protein
MAKKGELQKFTEGLPDDYLEGLVKQNTGSYDVNTRIMAISFMDAFQRDYEGKWQPHYSEVSRLTSIPVGTLASWWKKKEEIRRLHKTYIEALPDILVLKLGQEMDKIIDELSRRGYKKMATRDLVNVFSQFSQKFRLLTGSSTENIAHNHSYQPVSKKFVSCSKDKVVSEAVIIDVKDKKPIDN